MPRALTSVLMRGLVAPETVEGKVVDSDAALEEREPCGLGSSQLSHASSGASDAA